MSDMHHNLDHEIQQCKIRVDQLEADLQVQRHEFNRLLLEQIEQIYGINVGSVVIYQKGRYVVSRIDTRYAINTIKPWVYGHPFKKDGNPSAVERTLYTEWECETHS